MFNRYGKRKAMGLGSYPAISLAVAREKGVALRSLVANGVDPSKQDFAKSAPTFAECVEQFLEAMEQQWKNDKHRAQWRMTLGESYCASILKKPVDEIDTTDVLSILSPIWAQKAETASRIRGRIERVLDYAKSRGWRSGENPALWRGHLRNLLPPVKKLQRGHHPAMPYQDVPAFFKNLQDHEAVAARCLQFLILTASRSGEALNAGWSEFDFEQKVWTVPGDRMKSGRVHRVPLPGKAIQLVEPLRKLPHSTYVFPGQRIGHPMSAMAMTMLLRRMKLGHYTVHGFRSSFRDWVGDETNHAPEVAESALAHVSGDKTEQAYRRGDALEKRRQLMEDWSEFLG